MAKGVMTPHVLHRSSPLIVQDGSILPIPVRAVKFSEKIFKFQHVCYFYNMKTISDALLDVIMEYPYLELGLAMGLVNVAALARRLQPRLEELLHRPVTPSAIAMALHRLQPRLKERAPRFLPEHRRMVSMTVRSGLIKTTFPRTPQTIKKLTRLTARVRVEQDPYLTFTWGAREITLILDRSLGPELDEIFAGETALARWNHLAAISMGLPNEIKMVPGIYYNILKTLAWNGINVIEVISTYSEITAVLELKDVDTAFGVLLRYFGR